MSTKVNRGDRVKHLVLAVGFACLTTAPSNALILVGGAEPMPDHGWPAGVEKLVNLPSRMSWWEGPPFGGGEYHFQYTCKDAQEFNEALTLLAAIQLPRATRTTLSSPTDAAESISAPLPVLVVHDGPAPTSFTARGQDDNKEGRKLVWTLLAWCPENWHRLYNHPRAFWESTQPAFRQPVPPPTIDVYLSKDGPIDWAKVKVPDGIRVVDRRAKAKTSEASTQGVLHGHVYDMATHKPIAEAELTLIPNKKELVTQYTMKVGTDEQGGFRIENIPVGDFRVTVAAGQRYASRQAGVYRNENGTTAELAAFLSPRNSITGTVVDTEGRPIPNAAVSARNILGLDGLGYPLVAEVTDTTNEDGLFELTGLPKGCAQVVCRLDSMYQKTSIFELCDVPSDAIFITMTKTGNVRGKVRFGSMPPKQDVHVHICPVGGQRPGTWGGGSKCGPDGRFEFKNVPPGDYWVSTDSGILQGDESGAEKVTVKADETAEVKLDHPKKSGKPSGARPDKKPSPPVTTLPAVLGSPPYLLKASSAAPAVVIYYCAAGMRSEPAESSVIVEVWPNGQIAWSDNLVSGGSPYKRGSVKAERIGGVIESLAADRVFEDGSLLRGSFGPDSDYLVIRVFDGSKQIELASWHELFEANPNLVATSRGIEPLKGRNRSEVLAADSKEYRRFRAVWDRIRQEVNRITAEAGDVRSIPVE
ncbi:MAG: carboxypeptidase-like regulatory domain-containing protein [Phycisphaerae bacterium]|nr:carboxypeptidase-like regulatory domain-containing protein [Phycisphaerae bacterium]